MVGLHGSTVLGDAGKGGDEMRYGYSQVTFSLFYLRILVHLVIYDSGQVFLEHLLLSWYPFHDSFQSGGRTVVGNEGEGGDELLYDSSKVDRSTLLDLSTYSQ